jgi:hypothetical protein
MKIRKFKIKVLATVESPFDAFERDFTREWRLAERGNFLFPTTIMN